LRGPERLQGLALVNPKSFSKDGKVLVSTRIFYSVIVAPRTRDVYRFFLRCGGACVMLLKAGHGITTQKTGSGYEVGTRAFREEVAGQLKKSVLYRL
jgi:hypothetical protein